MRYETSDTLQTNNGNDIVLRHPVRSCAKNSLRFTTCHTNLFTFKYLGAITTENGDCSKKIQARLEAARGAVRDRTNTYAARNTTTAGMTAGNCTETYTLQYFGHVVRARNLCTEILKGRIDEKRRRGRPMRRWTDDIKNWSNRSVEECSRLARDRQQWRLLVHEMISDPQ